tara:strand:- start:6131 stop:6367 length:237 start_codon:yes stop_codon:yes gene_type:complete
MSKEAEPDWKILQEDDVNALHNVMIDRIYAKMCPDKPYLNELINELSQTIGELSTYLISRDKYNEDPDWLYLNETKNF